MVVENFEIPTLGEIGRIQLPGGTVLTAEKMGGVGSVALGVWLRQGSRSDPSAHPGLAHFIEHLIFKGTQKYDASAISRFFDRFGGVLDAFTSRESIGFLIRVQSRHLEESFSFLSEILESPVFPAKEVDRERTVIVQECRMVQDKPGHRASDLLYRKSLSGHPVSLPIQGNPKAIQEVPREAIVQHYHQLFRPDNIVVAAAGDVDLGTVKELWGARMETRAEGKRLPSGGVPIFTSGLHREKDDSLEQVQFLLGLPVTMTKEIRPLMVMRILANVLGGTMSSRLFSAIREQRGLVYLISAAMSLFEDTGMLRIHAAASPKLAPEAITVLASELEEFVEKGPRPGEVELAKDNIIGSTMLSLESPLGRVGRLVTDEIIMGCQHPLSELLPIMDAISPEEVWKLGRETLHPERGYTVLLGPSLDEVKPPWEA